jgi:hypothetical protein
LTPLVADVHALTAEVIAVGIICRLVDPAPVIGRTGCEGADRHAGDERRTPPALAPIAVVPLAPMPSQVTLMPPIDGGAAPDDAGGSILPCAAMPCGEAAAPLRADVGTRKYSVAVALNASRRAMNAAEASVGPCAHADARDGHAHAMKCAEVAAMLDAHRRAINGDCRLRYGTRPNRRSGRPGPRHEVRRSCRRAERQRVRHESRRRLRWAVRQRRRSHQNFRRPKRGYSGP